ncbi:hypothetical protein [Microbacterium sp. G2-8]|uniref:phage portal protein family protein n=1 Tax=Microbacterium sp. G2-8 TaxID=2842454 RepID=UPI001C89F661|nr:hypothetical protein [Microbacterium sp. G2-8]
MARRPAPRIQSRVDRARRVKADFVPASAATRERGYTTESADSWWTDLTNEPTPELRWPESVQVFENMVRQDAQASSVLSAIATPIMRTGWRIDGTGCDPEVVAHVSRDLGLPIVGEENSVPSTRTRGRFSWTEHLAVVVPDHLQFGHAVFEQVYYRPRSIDEGGDGLFHLRKLGYRPARTIAAWKVAADGGLIGVQQYATQTDSHRLTGYVSIDGTTLPVDRLVVYTNRRKGGNWIGESVLRSAYKNVMLKDRFLRIDAQVVERNGLGIPVHTAADNSPDSLDAGLDIAAGVQAGDNSGVSLAKDAKFELVGVTGSLPNILEKIKYHDEQISRSVLAHFLNLGSQTGSWALGSTFADFFTLSIQAVAENIRSTATKHVVEDLVDINYGPDVAAPRIVFDEIGSRQESILTAIASLIQSGVIHGDEDLEKFIRSTLGLPPATTAALAAANQEENA